MYNEWERAEGIRSGGWARGIMNGRGRKVKGVGEGGRYKEWERAECISSGEWAEGKRSGEGAEGIMSGRGRKE